MAAPSEIISGAIAENGLVKNSLLQAMIERIPYVLGVTEVLADLEQNSGLIYRVIHWQATGYAYYYDPSDTTTPDDGTTVIVDADGHRYHLAASSDIQVSSVIGTQNAPPGSPVENDAYIVGPAPTGAWVGHANDIAVYLLSGWIFAQPKIGHTLYVEGSGNVQFDENGDWVGFAVQYQDGTIPNSSLLYPFGIAVENTQDAPPVSPAVGLFYIVGDSPTGAWSGHPKDIAEWDGAAWKFYDPYVGASVYHKTFGYRLSYTAGSIWAGDTGSEIQTFDVPGSFTWNKPTKGSMALIQAWGAGGSGGRGASSPSTRIAGGGAGGAYVELKIPMASLPSTVSVTVGAGGAAQTVDGSPGQVGGNSSFGSILTAYGGGGGGSAISPATETGGGGGGGGTLSAGSTATAGAVGVGGTPAGDFGGGTGGVGGGTAASGGASVMGGAGGGGGRNSNATAGNGGASVYGGGGGAGARTAGTPVAAGGVSTFAGNGGNGGTATTAALPGTQPAGGGGGSYTANSGKGGDGLVRVTVW